MKETTYVITLSRVFPAKHPRAGQPTNFRAAFNNAQMCAKCRKKALGMCARECVVGYLKNHTMRGNYDLWAKRFEKIERGEACLSVRQWTGKSYASKQVEIMRLTREDGIGLQRLTFDFDELNKPRINGSVLDPSAKDLARNDGLSYEDWSNWFKGYDLSKPLAIIHFTNFRY